MSPDVVRMVLCACRQSPRDALAALEAVHVFAGSAVADRLIRVAEVVADSGIRLTRGAAKAEAERLAAIAGADPAAYLGDPDYVAYAELIDAQVRRGRPQGLDLLRASFERFRRDCEADVGFELSDDLLDLLLRQFLHGWSGTRPRIPMGRVILLAAMSGMGKTSLAQAFLLSALRSKCKCLYMQIELGEDSTIRDLSLTLAGIDRSTNWTREIEEKAVERYGREVGDRLFFPASRRKLHLSRLSAIRREIAWFLSETNDAPSRVVVLDFLQCLRGEPGRAQHELMSEIMQEIEMIAHSTGVTFVVLSQVTRAAQREFGAAIVQAATIKKAGLRAERIAAALDQFAIHGIAGGDGIRQHSDVVFTIGSVHDQKIVYNSKYRGHSWGRGSSAHETILVDLDDAGRWTTTTDDDGEALTLPAFVRRLSRTRATILEADGSDLSPPPPASTPVQAAAVIVGEEGGHGF